MKVYVYWNLHKGGYSIRACEGAAKGKVIAHAETVILESVTFKVSEGGRQRSIAKHKEVHAGMQGELVNFAGTYTDTGKAIASELETVATIWDESQATALKWACAAITYNPHKCATFIRRGDQSPISEARLVVGFTVDGRADCYAREYL